jgi:hypothetical protein
VSCEEAPEEAPGRCCVSSLLEQHVDDFVHEEEVAVSAVPTPQSIRVLRSERVAPDADRLVGDDDSSLAQQVLDIPVTEIETIVEPDGVRNDLSRKPVALVLSSRAFATSG